MEEIGRIISLDTTNQEGCTMTSSLSDNIPFRTKRAYWIYDVPGGESRGGHAHKRLRQIIIAVSGSFTVNLDNGREKRQYFLNHPDQGLYIDTGIWRTLDDFSSGAVCLVLASELYEPEDYLYDYDEFLAYVQQASSTQP